MKIQEYLKKISREQLYCVLAALILALASYFVSANQSFLKQGNRIERSVPGDVDKQYELNVKGLDGGAEKLDIRVSARQYTEKEAEDAMNQLIEELALYILGENENLQTVKTNLLLKKTIPGFEGVRLSWFPEDTSLVSYEGEVKNYALEAPVESSLRVVMKAGENRKEFVLPITVYPIEIEGKEALMEKLSLLVHDADAENPYDENILLPEEVGGYSISYEAPRNTGWIKIIALGILAFLLLGLKPEQDRRIQLKKRETELLMDYSDVVSKLVIYMGAGLTARNAWIRIAENYMDTLQKGQTETRIVYEEMCRTERELEKGVPEGKAFTEFAGRCSLNCYLKMVSLLEQNRKTGDARSEAALLMEAQEAFEQRKNIARRLGEEAGTKLMAPLIISLMTVMIIVAVPAMMTLT